MGEARRWLIPVSILLLILFIYLLSSVLTPFLIAAFLAYLTDPLVNRLQSWKLPRTLATTFVFIFLVVVFVLLLLIIVPMLEQQIVQLINTIPEIVNWIQQSIIPWLDQRLHLNVSEVVNFGTIKQGLLGHWQQAGGIAAKVIKTISQSGMTLVSWLVNLLLIPVVMFYLLRDWNDVTDGIHSLIPRRIEPTAVRLFLECDEVLSAFIRGQLMVMLGLGILYSVGLSIVGVDLALLIGMIAGLVSIVPYLGFIIGIVAASIAALFQFQDWIHVVGVWIVFAVAQGIEGSFLTPWLVGDKIGLHPVAVIFAVLAGGELFGFMGILLALPVSAVIMVFIRYIMGRYENSNLYKQQASEES